MDAVSLGAWIILGTNALVFLTTLTGLVVSVWNRKKITALAISVDGRLTQLLTLTTVSAHAEGKLEGADEEKKKIS